MKEADKDEDNFIDFKEFEVSACVGVMLDWQMIQKFLLKHMVVV